MIDTFSLGITHVLMLLAAWLLLRRGDLDREDGGAARGFGHPRKPRDDG
jgi:hypothetical protein